MPSQVQVILVQVNFHLNMDLYGLTNYLLTAGFRVVRFGYRLIARQLGRVLAIPRRLPPNPPAINQWELLEVFIGTPD